MQVRDNTTRTFFAELYVTKLEKKQARSYKVITLTSSFLTALKWQALEDFLCCLSKTNILNLFCFEGNM